MRSARPQFRHSEIHHFKRSDFVVDGDAGAKQAGDRQDGGPKKAGADDKEWFKEEGFPARGIGRRNFTFGCERMRKSGSHMEGRW